MTDSSGYTPPAIWTWDKESGGRFANINRPIAGSTHDQELPVGRHPLQLYSLATPNGVKVTVMLEELLALGHDSAEYDAWLIPINEGAQFSSGFVAVNPNSKIPALMDRSGPQPIRVFESGAILQYLAETFGGAFLPVRGAERAECLSWLFWQMGSAPFLGGGFGHFYAYAPTRQEYPIDRYAMEVKRQLDVLDRRLADSECCRHCCSWILRGPRRHGVRRAGSAARHDGSAVPGGGARAPQGVERQPRLVEHPDGAVEAKVTLHANDPVVPAAGLTAHMDAHCQS